jgi:hypothetical protein
VAKAVCNVVEREVKRTAKVLDSVTLLLSIEEALVVRMLVGAIGGAPENTCRPWASAVWNALSCPELELPGGIFDLNRAKFDDLIASGKMVIRPNSDHVITRNADKLREQAAR